MELSQFFRENPRVALAFSGGVDSAYLWYAALASGAQVGAFYVKTAFQPAFEYADALRVAKELGQALQVIQVDILRNEQVAENPWNRCYYCKNVIFSRILQEASQAGYPLMVDGTNASDDWKDRPGMEAARELEVRSPLRECGLTKERIRQLSREAGLFTWDKPSYACLATRIPTGQRVTAPALEKTEKAEDFLAGLGFRDFRVRLAGERARLQVTERQFPLVIEHREEILNNLKRWYAGADLDLEVRHGE